LDFFRVKKKTWGGEEKFSLSWPNVLIESPLLFISLKEKLSTVFLSKMVKLFFYLQLIHSIPPREREIGKK
jgi:hypothetical protein